MCERVWRTGEKFGTEEEGRWNTDNIRTLNRCLGVGEKGRMPIEGGVPLSSVGRWCRSLTHGTVPMTATTDTSLREAPDLPFLFSSDHQQNRRRLTRLDPPLPRRHASHLALPCDPKWVRTFELKECTCRRHHTMYILGSIGAYRSARQP